MLVEAFIVQFMRIWELNVMPLAIPNMIFINNIKPEIKKQSSLQKTIASYFSNFGVSE